MDTLPPRRRREGRLSNYGGQYFADNSGGLHIIIGQLIPGRGKMAVYTPGAWPYPDFPGSLQYKERLSPAQSGIPAEVVGALEGLLS